MAKKKHKKKHNFKHSQSGSTRQAVSDVVSKASPAASAAVVARPATVSNEWQLVRGDVRRVLILAAALITLELALWYVFNHTGLGVWLDGLIKL